MNRFVSIWIALLLTGCGDSDAPQAGNNRTPPDAGIDAKGDGSTDAIPDAVEDAVQDVEQDAVQDAVEETAEEGGTTPMSCEFGYGAQFTYDVVAPLPPPVWAPQIEPSEEADRIVHAEPPPPSTYLWRELWRDANPADLVMPEYSDDMPLFERAGAWNEPRCFETPAGVQHLTESQAFDLYRDIAEKTTGVTMNTQAQVRNVVGLRGAYPGQIAWNGNQPNRFNDTLALLWTEEDGTKHVREFPVNTDTGAKDFGYHNSSSLRPNRRYRHINGWHRGYNALSIDETNYRVRDDGNKNGHWDSDRNGWLPPAGSDDHDRTGSAHNIHMGSLNAPLGWAAVDSWSAGCQVIPGMTNWIEFITHAWTELGATVEYFLIDTRDIPSEVWSACTPDGSHACPFQIGGLPYTDTRNTETDGTTVFSVYNCSEADESGPEVVYVLNVDTVGTLHVSVDCQDPVDVDVHLMDGDDANACVARGHTSFDYAITPGRYLVIADSFAEGGTAYAGAFTLTISLN